MIQVDWLGSFAPLAVDLILVIGALSLLVVDIVLPAGEKRVLAWGTGGVLASALLGSFVLDLDGPAMGGVYASDALAVFFKQLFLGAAWLTTVGASADLASNTPRRQGEFYQLILYSVLGMSLLAGARDVVFLVVCFELMGIPLYVLAAWDRTRRRSVEGALKFFLVGAVSSVTLLFGFSLLVGLAGTTSLPELARYVGDTPSPAAWLGATLALGGMGFKLGVFPFHMWVPDTYQSTRTPTVAFLSVGPKAAGIVVLIQVLFAGGMALLQQMLLVLLALATATLIAGNYLALNQDNVKRLLAYSGVAHMGFLLMALAAGSRLGLQMTLFYLLGYLFTNLGAFFVVHAVKQSGGDDSVSSFDGLGRRSGWLGFSMLVFLLSLAGIPFVVGFWAKLYVFIAAWQAGFGWLVVLGAILSVVALFYYLRVARAMFMQPVDTTAPVRIDVGTTLVIAICLTFVIGMGLAPAPFLAMASSAATAFLGG